MPQREKVSFPANIPTIVELDGYGELQPSKNGEDEYRYFLENGRIMWVPPTVHEMIEAALAHSSPTGAPFEITRHQLKRGAAVEWTVRPANRNDAAEVAAAAARGSYDRSHRFGYSNNPTPTAPPPVSQPRSAERPTAAAPTRPQPQPAARLAAEVAAATAEHDITAADRMAACMADAIELWRGASSMEPALQWTAADVRALAATLFIEEGKR